jgi:DNA modification methylase
MVDIVKIGNATLYHGDGVQFLDSQHLGDSAVVVTDPPYGIAHRSEYTAATTTALWMGSEIANDSDTGSRDLALSYHDGDWLAFGSIKVPPPPGTRATLVWDKGPASGMGDLRFPWKLSYELIYVSGKGWAGSRDEGVIKGHWIVTRASMGRVHPNEKPVSLMEYLIDKHPAKIVCDPFMGSGTTGVACVNLGREFVGCEVDRRYFDIACERIDAAHRQQRLFA